MDQPSRLNAKQRLKEFVFAGLFLWVMAAWFVFKVRHPWTTGAETIVYWQEVVTFQKVPHSQMRPR